MIFVALHAPDTERPDADVLHRALDEPGALESASAGRRARDRRRSAGPGRFSRSAGSWSRCSTTQPGVKQPSVADFTKEYRSVDHRRDGVRPVDRRRLDQLAAQSRQRRTGRSQRDDQCRGAELRQPPLRGAGRAAWASCRRGSAGACSSCIGFILTYTLCYNIWSAFAFPFYLDFLHYSKDEVAFASKVFGIIMTMVGISLGGYLFLRIGRLPTDPDRRDTAGVRQFRLRRSCRRRRQHRFVRPCAAARRPRSDCSAPTSGWCGCLLAISLGEYLDRYRRRSFRCLSLGHRQPAVHCRAICAFVLAHLPDRLARTGNRRRSFRYLWLCDRLPLDRSGGLHLRCCS